MIRLNPLIPFHDKHLLPAVSKSAFLAKPVCLLSIASAISTETSQTSQTLLMSNKKEHH